MLKLADTSLILINPSPSYVKSPNLTPEKKQICGLDSSQKFSSYLLSVISIRPISHVNWPLYTIFHSRVESQFGHSNERPNLTTNH